MNTEIRNFQYDESFNPLKDYVCKGYDEAINDKSQIRITYKKFLKWFNNQNYSELSKKDLGLSISCDGVCLTLISCKKKIIEFYLSNETLNKSKFKNVKIKLLVKEGDDILVGTPLFFDKKNEKALYVSSCSGSVSNITFGERRIV